MSFRDLLVHGYRYADLSFTAVLDADAPGQEGQRMDGLALRDFGLGGGEIQVRLHDSNRPAGDPGVWYAVKCAVDPAAQAQGGVGANARIGDLMIKQMGPDHQELKLVSLDLEELDNSHLIDRIVGAVLGLHAERFGPGPHGPAVARPARR